MKFTPTVSVKYSGLKKSLLNKGISSLHVAEKPKGFEIELKYVEGAFCGFSHCLNDRELKVVDYLLYKEDISSKKWVPKSIYCNYSVYIKGVITLDYRFFNLRHVEKGELDITGTIIADVETKNFNTLEFLIFCAYDLEYIERVNYVERTH